MQTWDPPTVQAAPVQRVRTWPTVLVTAVTLVLVVAAAGPWRELLTARLGPGALPVGMTVDDMPPLPPDALPQRVLPQVTSLLSGPHAFLSTHPDGTPVVPDPCRPMHFAVNPAGMPAGGDAVVREAIAFVSEATGLSFVEDAPTTEVFDLERSPHQPELYGDRWAPLLIGWTDEANIEQLGGEVAAVALPATIAPSGPESGRVVGGQIAVDAAFTAESVASPVGRSVLRMVVMHELGHIVGLDHVEDRAQVMTDRSADYYFLGAGDLQGLALAGSGRCFTDT